MAKGHGSSGAGLGCWEGYCLYSVVGHSAAKGHGSSGVALGCWEGYCLYRVVGSSAAKGHGASGVALGCWEGYRLCQWKNQGPDVFVGVVGRCWDYCSCQMWGRSLSKDCRCLLVRQW